MNLEYNSEHFEFFANGFYNHITNYIFIAPTGGIIEDNPVFEYEQSNAALYGGEFGIHIHPHPLDWLHFTSSFETVTGKKENGDNLPLIPANQWKNTFKTNYKIGKWLKKGFATVQINHTLKQANNSAFETATSDYTLVNMGIGSTIHIGNKLFRLTLNGNNVLNKTYIAHLSRLKSDGIPNIGRNIILGLNFDF